MNPQKSKKPSVGFILISLVGVFGNHLAIPTFATPVTSAHPNARLSLPGLFGKNLDDYEAVLGQPRYVNTAPSDAARWPQTRYYKGVIPGVERIILTRWVSRDADGKEVLDPLVTKVECQFSPGGPIRTWQTALTALGISPTKTHVNKTEAGNVALHLSDISQMAEAIWMPAGGEQRNGEQTRTATTLVFTMAQDTPSKEPSVGATANKVVGASDTEVAGLTGHLGSDLPKGRFQDWSQNALDQSRVTCHSPGAWMAVYANGVCVAACASGDSNLNKRRAASIDDRVAWGSISKAITGTLACRLIQEGKLSWSMRAADVLPELYNSGLPSAKCLDATVAQLLSHKAGLGNNPPVNVSGKTPQEIRYNYVKAILAMQPVGAVGEKSSYARGSEVVGLMLERLTNRSLEALVKDELLAPCGVKQLAQLGDPWADRISLDVPVGYLDDAGSPASFKILDGEGLSGWPSGMHSASGAMYGTIDSLAKLVASCVSANKSPFGGVFSSALLQADAGDDHTHSGWSLTDNSNVVWSAGQNGRGSCVVAVNLTSGIVVSYGINQCDAKYYTPCLDFAFATLRTLSSPGFAPSNSDNHVH